MTNPTYAVDAFCCSVAVDDVPNTWFISTPLGDPPAAATVPIRNSYAADLAFTVTVPAAADWLVVEPANGTLDIDEETSLTFAVDRGALAPGKYTADVEITAGGFGGFPVVVPVAFYVYGAETPQISVAPTTLAYATTIGVHPTTQTFILANPGELDLDWEAWPDREWISIPGRGEVALLSAIAATPWFAPAPPAAGCGAGPYGLAGVYDPWTRDDAIRAAAATGGGSRRSA